MLFALPGYQFPYTVMNRCLSLPYLSTISTPSEAVGDSEPGGVSAKTVLKDLQVEEAESATSRGNIVE
jgi:hypothetical protein